MTRSQAGELPVVGQRPAERADAVRNRRKILRAAARLLADGGVERLSLDDVAAAAEVGVGTVYRRFRDRTGLAIALLDEREKEFQQAFMSGPPPLGPGAPPADRVRAFLHALVDRVRDQFELVLVAESAEPAIRYGEGAYPFRHFHLVTLLRETVPDRDVDYLAAALLAPLSASLLAHQIRDQGRDVESIRSGIDDLVELTLGGGS
ncbi:TetR family transcriptional regulator [Herbihabitans rhizosphaerae]|uniref:TetR family transcriptional regulator n=1 Tax=Herbihabitans rhizosphaerae TaxID=1872711 RepID=A0A4Q7KVW2_9PSEU|nr:TetR/AcrR family transcriptional regulator [Herbihabitans rhizosphaerae]RZS40864.1 TetR family transcriptional regulator [Herbihabitans rhizosphaerae]